MALKHKTGEPVRVTFPEIRGIVTDARVVNDDVQYHVEFLNNQTGEHDMIWMSGDRLETVEEAVTDITPKMGKFHVEPAEFLSAEQAATEASANAQ